MRKIKIAIVGMGKIARDQHVPALAANAEFELIAVTSPNGKLAGVANFTSIAAMLDALPEIDAVSLCTTPQVRYDIARYALEHGKHVMLEKPPGVTVSEVHALAHLAHQQQLALFTTWHSREAAAVEPARQWLKQRTIRNVKITWKEDVRVWHPGQTWVWQAGGLGVFDPGINALSIVTRILPQPLVLTNAELSIPSNCATPIAAKLVMTMNGVNVDAEFDFRQIGPQSWDIEIDTDMGVLLIAKGGATMRIGNDSLLEASDKEYPNLYARFATLVNERRADVDVTPLQLVADAFLCGRHLTVEPFIE